MTSTPVLIVALWVVWSTTFLAVKVGVSVASPAAYTLLRVLAALAVVLVALAAQPRLWRGLRDPRLHLTGLVLGLTNTAGFMILQTVGLQHAPVGLASVLIYVQPILVALGAAWWLGERLRPRQVLGIVAGWAGVVLIVVEELDLGSTPAAAIAILLGAALAWALGTLAFKAVGGFTSPWLLLAVQVGYGLPPVALFALVAESTVQWGGTLALTAGWAGAAGVVAGFGLQFLLLRRGQAGVVSSWIFPVPILAALLGVVFLDERLRLGLVLGAAAVVLGIYLVNTPVRRG